MKYLIIGSEGLIGKMFTDILFDGKNEIVGYDNIDVKEERKYVYLNRNIELEDINKLKEDLEKYDGIGIFTPTNTTINILKILLSINLKNKLIFEASSVKNDMKTYLIDLSSNNEVLSTHPMFAPNINISGKNLVYISLNRGNKTNDILNSFDKVGLVKSETDFEKHNKLCTLTISLNHIISLILSNSYDSLNLGLDDSKAFITPPHDIYLSLASRVVSNNLETSVNIQLNDVHLVDLIENTISFLQSYKSKLIKKDVQGIYEEFEKINNILNGKKENYFEKSKKIINNL